MHNNIPKPELSAYMFPEKHVSASAFPGNIRRGGSISYGGSSFYNKLKVVFARLSCKVAILSKDG